jgi:hypothetical protein
MPINNIINLESIELPYQIDLINIVMDAMLRVICAFEDEIESKNPPIGLDHERTLVEEVKEKWFERRKEIKELKYNLMPSTLLERMQVEKQIQEKELFTLEK